MSKQLRVNPIACSGHGQCAELLPELIKLDEWGYPVLDARPVPPGLDRTARRAVASCPALALLLSPRRDGRPRQAAAPGGCVRRQRAKDGGT